MKPPCKMAHEAAQPGTADSRFLTSERTVVGIVTAVDVAGKDRQDSILTVMTKDVLMVDPRMLVSHLSRMLVWEGFELVPIVERHKLVGVVSRQDIIKAFQQTQKQPHVGETIDNLVMSGFKLEKWTEEKGTEQEERKGTKVKQGLANGEITRL